MLPQSDVRDFLERRCNLSALTPLPGSEAEEHVEGFRVWRDWLRIGFLSAPFEVVHVDAHSDLGSGPNRSFSFFQELLQLPLSERAFPTLGPDELNSGNYLLGAIANRWIGRLTYVSPDNPAEPVASAVVRNPPGDVPAWVYRDSDWKAGVIQLALDEGQDFRRVTKPKLDEPPVPFARTLARNFKGEGFTHLFLARSPQYTPRGADSLLPVIREYFHSDLPPLS